MGRKRRVGAKRRPDGRVSYERAETAAAAQAVALGQRLKRLAAEHAADPRRGSILGALLIEGFLTEQQYAAGVTWERLVRRHARLHGLPLPGPAQARLPVASTLPAASAQRCRTDDLPWNEEEEAADLHARLTVWRRLLVERHGRHVLTELQAVSLENQPPDDRQLLRAGLETLVAFLGLRPTLARAGTRR